MAGSNTRIRKRENSLSGSHRCWRHGRRPGAEFDHGGMSNDPVLECGVRTDPFNVPSLGATARYVSSDPPAANEYARRVRSE